MSTGSNRGGRAAAGEWPKLLNDTIDALTGRVLHVIRCHEAIRGLLSATDEFPCLHCGWTDRHQAGCPWVPLWAIYHEESRPGHWRPRCR